eukprot:Pgem_evm1s9261
MILAYIEKLQEGCNKGVAAIKISEGRSNHDHKKTYNTTQGFLTTIPAALDSVHIVYLYDKKLSYNVLLYAHKKYKSHRR